MHQILDDYNTLNFNGAQKIETTKMISIMW